MENTPKFLFRWIACVQLALLLSGCARAQPLRQPAGSLPASEQGRSLWTNTFPSLPDAGAVLRFSHYSLEEGLSQSTVQAILQDDQGFLWIGTQDGLNRFDGYSFTVYRSNPLGVRGLSSDEILCLAQGVDGGLWIGTDIGLNRYDPATGQFLHWLHDAHDPNSLVSDRVQALLQGPNGVLWVGTQEGLDAFYPASGKFIHVTMPDKLPGSHNVDSVNALYLDEHHTLWIGTDDGLISYGPGSGQFHRYRNQSRDASSLSFDQVASITEDARGTLWVGTHLGLDRLDRQSGLFSRFMHSDQDAFSLSDDYVQVVYVDREGQVWIGTRNDLNRFDAGRQQFVHYENDVTDPASLSGNVINAVYEDRGGMLWVGTLGGGLNEHDRSQDQFAYYHHSNVDPASLSSNMISPIIRAANGQLWVGTYDAGLNLLDPQSGRADHFRHDASNPDSLSNDTVLSLFLDQDNVLWVGTRSGLDSLLPASSKFTHYVHSASNPNSIPLGAVYAIYQDSSSMYWVGTAQGLRLFDPSTGRFSTLDVGNVSTGLDDSPIMSIYQDRSGILWFGTETYGLFRFDPTTRQLQQYRSDSRIATSLSSSSILDVYQDVQGRLWVGTFGGGLDLYLPNLDGFAHYGQAQGLPDDTVYGILDDQRGDLWLSTNHGLSRFDVATNTFQDFTAKDGLQDNRFNSFAFSKDGQGRLYFGGVQGLTAFDPTAIRRDSYVPPVAITSLTTETGKALSALSGTVPHVTISYPQNSFDFSFAALSFAQIAGNQYKYVLDGFDHDWHTAGPDHRGSYTNLPGGVYTLRIIGSNSDGVWNQVGATMQVTVIPPFWQTWRFRAAALLALIAGIVVAYRSRVRAIEVQKAALERVVQERTQTLEKRNLDLEALYSADARMLRVLSQDQVLQVLVDVAVETLEADKSAVFIRLPGHATFAARVCRGFQPGAREEPLFVESQQGVLSDAAARGPIVLDDIRGGQVGEMMAAYHLRSAMYMPIRVQDAALGIFAVYCSSSPYTFNETRQRLFASLVQRAALSIENSRLFEETRHVAMLEERSRLGRDLHDSTKQKAFAALAQLGAAKKLVGPTNGGAAERLGEAENIISEVVRDLTFFIQEFYPGSLKEKGLAPTVRNYAFAWQGRCGVRLDVSIVDERRLPLEIEQVLYRVVQEALSTISRHSEATEATIQIVYGRDAVQIEIGDNGVGFDPATAARGLGLQLIEERVDSIGGQVDIESHLGNGTHLSIRVGYPA